MLLQYFPKIYHEQKSPMVLIEPLEMCLVEKNSVNYATSMGQSLKEKLFSKNERIYDLIKTRGA